MTRVRVGAHVLLNLSRRSLCDNCVADICFRERKDRIFECQDYRPIFLVFKRCSKCGELFEVHRNLCSLDPELCQQCNSLNSD